MNRTLIACAAAATLGLASAAQPAQAGNGGAIAAGVIGGIAAGAIIAGAARGAYDGPVYAPAYAPAPVYEAPDVETCVQQRQVWSERYRAYVVRNVRVPCY
jgi:hypothetical protein